MKAPLDVAVVTSLFPSPGRPREGVFAAQRWRRMSHRGHNVRIIHPQPFAPPLVGGRWADIRERPAEEVRGRLVIHRPRYLHIPRFDRWNAYRFAGAAEAGLHDGEIVVCDYAWPASALAPRCRARGQACWINGRGSDVLEVAGEAGLGGVLAKYLAASTGWMGVSQDLVEHMDTLAEQAGRSRCGQLVPNGVDLDLFIPRETSGCRQVLQLDSEGPLVLVVGHLIPRKDPLLALEVFARVCPSVGRLLFIGSGPLEGDVARRAASLGLADRVTLLGECDPEQLGHYYGAADLTLLVSKREGRPNVVLEALASGCPVLATDVGGTREILGPGQWLCESRDVDALAQRATALLESPPTPQSLRSLVEGLTWDASCATLEDLLRSA